MSAIQQVLIAGGKWSPRMLSNVRGWWAADNPANTITSGLVATAADMSGNSNNLTAYAGTSTNRALLVTGQTPNGRSIWRADATTNRGAYVSSDLTVSQNASGLTLAIVCRANPAGGTQDQNWLRINVNGVNTSRAMIGRGSYASNAVYAGGRRLDADSFDGANDNTNYSTNWLVIVASFDYANATLVMSVNGTTTTDATFQAAGNTSNTTANNSNVGHSGAGPAATSGNGDYAEVLIRRGASTTDERQKLEGYLAWASGVTLASGHPYEFSPP